MKIGFFGCGNMGRTLAEGIRRTNPSAELYFYSPGQDKAQALALQLNGIHLKNSDDMPGNLDWYILAFKPQSLPEFNFSFPAQAKILSVLAGTDIRQLSSRFNVQTIARLMPNTPSSLGAGANLLFAPHESETLKLLLAPLGRIFIMDSEEQLDHLTPFSGSGPALIFEFARLFERSLLKSTSHGEARELVIQTFLGSALLMQEAHKRGQSFEELRQQVTSPKGVTFEALKFLNEKNLEGIMDEAFQAAYSRTLEIKKGLL